MKRKSLDALDSSRGGQLYHHNPSINNNTVSGSASPITNSGLLPDINNSAHFNKVSLGLDKLDPPHVTPTTSGKGAAASAAAAAVIAAASKGGTIMTPKSAAASRVPILTLPGGLTSAAAVSASPLYSNRSEGVAHLVPSYSTDNSSYCGEMPGIGFEKDKEKRKKSSHGKHKVPKANGNTSSRMNDTQILPSSINNKVPVSGRQSPVAQPLQEIAIDEAGSGVAAGPIDDWGFANENSPSTNGGQLASNRGGITSTAGKNNQEMEYSDDEDFEPDDSTPIPHPPYAGSKPPGSATAINNRKLEKKKKKKAKQASGDQLANIYGSPPAGDLGGGGGGGGHTLKQQSPRVVMLPPIS